MRVLLRGDPRGQRERVRAQRVRVEDRLQRDVVLPVLVGVVDPGTEVGEELREVGTVGPRVAQHRVDVAQQLPGGPHERAHLLPRPRQPVERGRGVVERGVQLGQEGAQVGGDGRQVAQRGVEVGRGAAEVGREQGRGAALQVPGRMARRSPAAAAGRARARGGGRPRTSSSTSRPCSATGSRSATNGRASSRTGRMPAPSRPRKFSPTMPIISENVTTASAIGSHVRVRTPWASSRTSTQKPTGRRSTEPISRAASRVGPPRRSSGVRGAAEVPNDGLQVCTPGTGDRGRHRGRRRTPGGEGPGRGERRAGERVDDAPGSDPTAGGGDPQQVHVQALHQADAGGHGRSMAYARTEQSSRARGRVRVFTRHRARTRAGPRPWTGPGPGRGAVSCSRPARRPPRCARPPTAACRRRSPGALARTTGTARASPPGR